MKYGYRRMTWDDALKLGIGYAVTPLDPLTEKVEPAMGNICFCSTEQQAQIVVSALNTEGGK